MIPAIGSNSRLTQPRSRILASAIAASQSTSPEGARSMASGVAIPRPANCQ